MRGLVLGLLAGLVFGGGLLLSGMTRPGQVLAFLDPLSGWNASLALVMGGAVATYAVAAQVAKRLDRPLWGAGWKLPTKVDIDRPLVVGAVLFGLGWGLAGYCPGPALTAVAGGAPSTVTFVVAMIAGMFAHDLWSARTARRGATGELLPVGPGGGSTTPPAALPHRRPPGSP